MAWERAPWWFTVMLNGFRETGSGRSQIPGKCRGTPQRPWLKSLLVVLGNEPFKEILAHPSLQRLVRWSPIFLMSFTSSSRKCFCRKSQRLESVWAEPRACRSKRGPVQVLLQGQGSFYGILSLPTHLGKASTRPWGEHVLVLQL